MTDTINHDYTRDIVCPYCGHEHRDSWEISKNEDGAGGDMECQECDKTFSWHCTVSVDYCTDVKP
jgi:hypothetical protein